jgi:hypothetical protein
MGDEQVDLDEKAQDFLMFVPAYSTSTLIGFVMHSDWLSTYSDDYRVRAKMREALEDELNVRIPPRMTAEEIRRNTKGR